MKMRDMNIDLFAQTIGDRAEKRSITRRDQGFFLQRYIDPHQ
jgi:hypothetical protein